MKILVSSDLSETAATIFREGRHDVATMRETGRTFASPPDVSRLLVARTEILPELARRDCGDLGVLLLDDKAASPAGLQNLVLPILHNWQQKQLNKVFTLISGDTRRRITYLSYEGGREVAKVVVPADCTELFLHAGSDRHDEMKAFGIKLAGMSHVSPPYEVYRNRYDFHVLALVESGALDISTPAGQCTVKPGEALFIPAGTQCHYRSQKTTTFLWFHLDPEVFPNLRTPTRGQTIHIGRMHKQDVLMVYARQYREEATSIYADADEALLSLATLIGQILRRYLSDSSLPVPHAEHDDDRHKLQRAVSLLHDGTTQFWNVQNLAQSAGCSVSRFHRLTRKFLNKTPYQMILDVRMQRACDLLIHTGFKLEQIALVTGYADAFSFSSAFKHHTGKSPSEYRDAHRFSA